MAGPRNNYSRLPWAVRRHILGLLHDGAEYDEVRQDSTVAAALRDRNLVLHNATFLAVKRSLEYKDYVNKAAIDAAAKSANKILSGVITNDESLGDLTEISRYELAKLIRETILSTGGSEDAVKQIRGLALSLNAISRSELDRKLENKNAEIAALKDQLAVQKSDYEKQIATLGQTIEQLRKLVGTASSSEVSDAMDAEFLG